jgi:2C-methyl-D-erythritol 2,4-cyclodiphosphate synthase
MSSILHCSTQFLEKKRLKPHPEALNERICDLLNFSKSQIAVIYE